MTKREEVELSLEAEFGTYVWSDLGGPTRDALISREMRVRELEAKIAELEEEATWHKVGKSEHP